MIHLDYRDARPIYAQIIEGYRQQILRGILSPGDRLPSVRELAAELTINPNTIQRAYRQLESEGWIMMIPGKGCFVRGVPPADPREEAELLRVFDDAAARLLRLGYTWQELEQRLKEEENKC